MKIYISFILLFFLSMNTFSADADLQNAAGLYAKGQYEQAASIYENEIKTQGIAPELYYNLGNAYFKSGETGKAILNYERALRISPLYADARVNLEFANQKVVDNIVSTDSFFLKRWNDTLMDLLTSNQWLYISVGFFMLALISVFVFIFGSTRTLRQIFFYSGFFVLAISIISFFYSGSRKSQMTDQRDAIVMSGVMTVKSSPDKSGTDLFQLHEGTKVEIISTLGNWDEIKLGNGNVGWVNSKNIEAI